MSTFLHPHITCVWGDIPIGLGMGVVTFKPSVKFAKQVVNALIIFITSITSESPSRPLDCSNRPIPSVISWSF